MKAAPYMYHMQGLALPAKESSMSQSLFIEIEPLIVGMAVALPTLCKSYGHLWEQTVNLIWSHSQSRLM